MSKRELDRSGAGDGPCLRPFNLSGRLVYLRYPVNERAFDLNEMVPPVPRALVSENGNKTLTQRRVQKSVSLLLIGRDLRAWSVSTVGEMNYDPGTGGFPTEGKGLGMSLSGMPLRSLSATTSGTMKTRLLSMR